MVTQLKTSLKYPFITATLCSCKRINPYEVVQTHRLQTGIWCLWFSLRDMRKKAPRVWGHNSRVTRDRGKPGKSTPGSSRSASTFKSLSDLREATFLSTYLFDKLFAVSRLNLKRELVQIIFHFGVTSSLKRIKSLEIFLQGKSFMFTS